MSYYTRNGELKHHGILGMRWGVRRYQNKDGTLTPLGKKHLAEKGIRTEDNLVEKTIPKGTKMYRVTPEKKDKYGSDSTYVSYLDVDRSIYKEGSFIKNRAGKKTDDPVFEHEYELSTDIHIPSLKTVRTIEKKVVSNEIKRQEASRAWMDYYITAQGYSVKDLKDISRIADEYSKTNTEQQREAWCDKACSKYGRDKGVKYCIYAIKMAEAKDYVDGYKYFTIEQGLARAPGIKSSIIKELKNLGYNAMYDNASIGVNSDGEYHKRQEGVEPLIIFDGKSTLRETGVNKVTKDEQKRALDTWYDWARERDKALEKFKDTTWG